MVALVSRKKAAGGEVGLEEKNTHVYIPRS